MSLDIDEVRHVAKLARLAMKAEEMLKVLPQLNTLIERFETLQSVNTENVEPTSHAVPFVNVFRIDEVVPSLRPESFLRSAPEAENGMFLVPRIVEEGN